MSVQTLHDTGADYTVLSKYDGGVYQVATRDCVIQGVGDEFTLNSSNSSLTVSFNAGSEAVIGGSFFKITSTEYVSLTANATIYLCANINLSNANGMRGSFVQRTASNMYSENINGSGIQRDLLLYILTTDSNGVTTVTDRRTILSSSQISYNDLIDKPIIPGGTITSVRVQGTSPVTSSENTAQTGSLDTTISLANAYGDIKNPYGNKNANLVLAGPTSGSASVPSFRSLTANDIPGLDASKIGSGTFADGRLPNVSRLSVLTTAPTSANSGNVKIVYLASNPSTKYAGYIYLIKG